MSEGGISLEIGPGDNPLLPRLRPDLLGTGKKIFLERKKENVPGLKKSLSEIGVETPEIIVGDISTLSLNEKVDTVLISNVFDAQGIATLNWETRTIDTLDIGDEKEIVRQITNLCKPGSKVVVMETYGGIHNITKSELKKLFTDNGFELIETHTKEKNDLDKIFDQTTDEGMSDAKAINVTSAPDSFTWVFRKV